MRPTDHTAAARYMFKSVRVPPHLPARCRHRPRLDRNRFLWLSPRVCAHVDGRPSVPHRRYCYRLTANVVSDPVKSRRSCRGESVSVSFYTQLQVHTQEMTAKHNNNTQTNRPESTSDADTHTRQTTMRPRGNRTVRTNKQTNTLACACTPRSTCSSVRTRVGSLLLSPNKNRPEGTWARRTQTDATQTLA
eukprot:7380959-Prymnesium_polylepis.3